MNPDPYLVEEAARYLRVEPKACVLVGDSVSDVLAGLAADVMVVGLAKTRQRGEEPSKAGASALLRHPE